MPHSARAREPIDGSASPRTAGLAPRAGAGGLTLAALGVVFGDIGTSPLYSLQTVFSLDHGAVRPTPEDVYGVISMMFWSITLIVSVKYVSLVMRADNQGEGGVMALAALVRASLGESRRRTAAILGLAILGAALFYGDSVITPAISVLSAMEGIGVAAPELSHIVLPVAVTILAVLFAVQHFGTGKVGSLFGPVMATWFTAIAVAGVNGTRHHPAIVKGLSPTYVVSFVIAHPFFAFLAMGAVVLCITGAEALYADMGHFGRAPIRRAWFFIVFPALTLNYLGQGALVLADPQADRNPFFLLVPDWAVVPMVVLATAATVIASQAVISGAFSVSRQAGQLGFLPPLRVRQTSEHAGGQVYLPAINWALFAGVLTLVVTFRTSARLATAYGVAVTGALVIDTVLVLIVARVLWDWPTWKLAIAAIAFGGVEATFLAANLTKVAQGGWLPLLIAAGVFVVMTTWRRGARILTANRAGKEGSLRGFVDDLHDGHIPRVPGTAVFPHPSIDTTPLALRLSVEHIGVLHDHVIIVSASAENVPHVAEDESLHVDDLGHDDDGIYHLTLRHGFSESPDIPAALARSEQAGLLVEGADLDRSSYFLSRATIRRTAAPGMARWRKQLFIALTRNAADPAEYFQLPGDRTVLMGTQVDL
ncbi:MAG: system potassium uptake protein [Actinomycetota bacterium]|nr:system potassium uptake protein [Actinomycetota bacterium]